MKEPVRLFSEGGSLAQALGELRGNTPSVDRLERMAQNLSGYGIDVKVEPPQSLDAPKSGTQAATGKAASSAAAKIAASIGGVVALGIAIALLGRGTPEPTAGPHANSRDAAPPTAPDVHSSPMSPASAPTAIARLAPQTAPVVENPAALAVAPSAPTPNGVAPHDQSPAPLGAVPPADSERNAGSEPNASARSSSSTPRSASDAPAASERSANTEEPELPTREPEIALLKRAREALARNPGTALALAEQHRELYPKGRLGQEREVIAVTALMRMGLPTSAKDRAEQFKRSYPRSAYIGQLERIVGAN